MKIRFLRVGVASCGIAAGADKVFEKLKEKGYSPKSADARFVVAWKGEEDTEETPIVLTDIYFERAI